MLYFTPAFEDIIPDVEAFVAVVLAETNEGYINSEIPIRVKPFCLEKLEMEEIKDARSMLPAFRSAKGK